MIDDGVFIETVQAAPADLLVQALMRRCQTQTRPMADGTIKVTLRIRPSREKAAQARRRMTRGTDYSEFGF